jgi:hypothetical protein
MVTKTPALRKRAGRLAVSVILLCWAAAFQHAGANPVPPSVSMVHFPEQPMGSCAAIPFLNCVEVRQSTPELGAVEFDLIVDFLGAVYPVEGTFAVDWPEDWTVLQYEVCLPGATIEFEEHGAWIYFDQDCYSRVARFVMNVTCFGRLRSEGWGEDVLGWPWFTEAIPGWAGDECNDCDLPCDVMEIGETCQPHFEPGNLYLSAEQGAVVVAEADLYSSTWIEACDVIVGATVPWISPDVEHLSGGCYRVTVSADASGLAPGEHIGWVRATSEPCTRCMKVILTVTGATPAEAASWGKIKVLYR